MSVETLHQARYGNQCEITLMGDVSVGQKLLNLFYATFIAFIAAAVALEGNGMGHVAAVAIAGMIGILFIQDISYARVEYGKFALQVGHPPEQVSVEYAEGFQDLE